MARPCPGMRARARCRARAIARRRCQDPLPSPSAQGRCRRSRSGRSSPRPARARRARSSSRPSRRPAAHRGTLRPCRLRHSDIQATEASSLLPLPLHLRCRRSRSRCRSRCGPLQACLSSSPSSSHLPSRSIHSLLNSSLRTECLLAAPTPSLLNLSLAKATRSMPSPHSQRSRLSSSRLPNAH